MKQVFDTIEKLRATSSTNEKLAILMEQKENAGLKHFLLLTYEPRINYYMKAVDTKSKAPLMDFRIEKFSSAVMQSVVDNIASRNITGDAARRWVNGLYHALEFAWEKELLELMIQRDVKAGISKGTINKVWPGLITDTPYMRCTLPSAVDLASWPWEQGVYSQIKADGQFANISHHERTGKVTIESRNGSPMPLEYFDNIVREVKESVPTGHQLHGELLIKKHGKILPRQEGNGIFNSLLQGGELEAGHEIVYHAWDTIPVSEAKSKNKYDFAYEERFSNLKDWFGDHEGHISIIEHKVVYSLQEAYAHAVEAMGLGLEGTVIKHPAGIWEDSDGSKNQVKLKLQFEMEVRVVGFKEADKKSKNKDLFGSLMCESECGKFRVNVSGIKDDKRKDLFNRKDQILGKLIITISCNGLMAPNANTDGYWSCFLPRFLEERLDKTQADTLEQMKVIEDNAKKMGAIYGKKK
jgi:DNA ligase-1